MNPDSRPARGLSVARCGGIVALLALSPLPALAYPSSVVFAPSGDVKGLWDVGIFAYSSLNLTPLPVAAGTSWLGVNIGVLPRFDYGKSGIAFGGLEVGIDALFSDLAGTPNAFVKPVLNMKAQLMTETKYVPHLSIGAMGLAVFRPERSLSMVYGSLTKSIEIRKVYVGRVTLGLGGVLGDQLGDPFKAQYPLFTDTWPFRSDSKLVLLAGYESPPFGPFYFALDHVGGSGEINSTNLALNFSPIEGGTVGVGAFLGNDPQNWFAGVFAYLFISFNVAKTFAKKPDPPAAMTVTAPSVPVPGVQ